jgi:hypothetical protein
MTGRGEQDDLTCWDGNVGALGLRGNVMPSVNEVTRARPCRAKGPLLRFCVYTLTHDLTTLAGDLQITFIAFNMANLTSLPNELLGQIFDHFLAPEKSQQTLVSLCRVSRRFLPIAQDRLYVSPEYDQNEVHIRSLEVSTTLLARTLIENDRLRFQVRHLTFCFGSFIDYSRPCLDVEAAFGRMVPRYAYFTELLQRRIISWAEVVILLAQNLQTLTVRGIGMTDEWILKMFGSLWLGIFHVTPAELEAFNALQSLHTLKIDAYSVDLGWLMLANLR